jgi:nuclear pore complex protein Nup210
VASLLLEPSEVWIVPGTILPLTLFQIKHGKKYEIKLPSSVYIFSVENEQAATYDRATSTVTALDYGEAKINVMDKNWVDELEEYSEALTAKIHVTEPKYLSLSVYPYKNWAVVMGNVYEVQVDVFNADNQKIFVGDVRKIKINYLIGLYYVVF